MSWLLAAFGMCLHMLVKDMQRVAATGLNPFRIKALDRRIAVPGVDVWDGLDAVLTRPQPSSRRLARRYGDICALTEQRVPVFSAWSRVVAELRKYSIIPVVFNGHAIGCWTGRVRECPEVLLAVDQEKRATVKALVATCLPSWRYIRTRNAMSWSRSEESGYVCSIKVFSRPSRVFGVAREGSVIVASGVRIPSAPVQAALSVWSAFRARDRADGAQCYADVIALAEYCPWLDRAAALSAANRLGSLTALRLRRFFEAIPTRLPGRGR